MQPPVKTSSAHRSTFLRGTHSFDIIGYGKLKALGVRSTVRSGDFEAGGRTWALICFFDVLIFPAASSNPPHHCHLASISLELVSSNHKDVIAKASVRIDDPTPPSPSSGNKRRRRCQWPPAVWQSAEAHTFPATAAAGDDSQSQDARFWKLSVPDAFRESVHVKDDRLTIHCTVDVLLQEKVATSTRNCFVAVVPPPTISRDLGNLLCLGESSKPGTDVTFVVEQTEIHAHRLVLGMLSPVFAAELLGGMKESTACARVTVDDMSASTFKAMLFFIYTDELPGNFHKPRQDNDVTTTTKSHLTMVGDLLVAADRYDLERLRLICEKILAENIDAESAMTTLMLVHGRDRCRRLEACCIEYMASHPTVDATKEYTELKEKCGPFLTDVLERVWMRALAIRTHDSPRHLFLPPHLLPPPLPPPPSSKTIPQKSASMINLSEVFTGSHEFRIADFSAAHKMCGVNEHIESGSFDVGGYKGIICVYPTGYNDGEGYIGMCLEKLAETSTTATNASVAATFRIHDPRGKAPPIIRWGEHVNGSGGTCFAVHKFTEVGTAKSYYVKYDGSLTVHCDVTVSKECAYTTSCSTAAGATATAIVPPSSNIACHLEQLLASQECCFDMKFQVHDSQICAHQLVIAARSPTLHAAVSSAPDKDYVMIDDIDIPTFKAMLHFIYADELPLISMLGKEATAVARDLLVAADRFGLDRMKAMCENLLCQLVTAESVLATLELADRHGFQVLKDFFLDYISQPYVLKEAVETKSFKDLKATSPGLLEEIILKISKVSSIDS